MRYEIIKVANGYMVREPAYCDSVADMSEIHVFPTFAKASAWLKKKFEERQS